MAKEYGTAIRPEIKTEKMIDDIADHLNWSKNAVLTHCIKTMYPRMMVLPRAVRPEDEMGTD